MKSLIEELTNRSSLDNYRRARVAIDKQVVIFLHFVAYNLSVSELVNSYYYTRSTYSRVIRRVSVAIYQIAEDYIQLPDDKAVNPALRQSKFYYFKGALGTLDGTFINAVIPEERQSA